MRLGDIAIPPEPDYSWIKVKRYVMDESLSWEERYRALEKHHLEETSFLLDKIHQLKDRAIELEQDVADFITSPSIREVKR